MSVKSATNNLAGRMLRFPKLILQKMLYKCGLRGSRFRGVYPTYEEALASIRPGLLAGYDHDPVVTINCEYMCQIRYDDWPILYWLQRLAPVTKCLLDAGGHIGTKYRAFRNHLDLNGLQWVVYDLPTVVRRGRDRATAEGLTNLHFIDKLSTAPDADALLTLGLFQYLHEPLDKFFGQLPSRPRHLLVSKVAVREGPTIVTLENFRCAEVPYFVRNRAEFFSSLTDLGYDIVDQWESDLPRAIPSHPEVGNFTSCGCYARLRDSSETEADLIRFKQAARSV